MGWEWSLKKLNSWCHCHLSAAGLPQLRPQGHGGPPGPTGTTRAAELLTHGFQLPDELLLRPLGPLLLVGVDGAEDGPAGFAAVLDGRDVEIVHQDDVGVLGGETETGSMREARSPSGVAPSAGADRPGGPPTRLPQPRGARWTLAVGTVPHSIAGLHPLDASKPTLWL